MNREIGPEIRIREAVQADIPEMHRVRLSVKENKLNNPALVTLKDYEAYMAWQSKGWVCESNGTIQGFAIVSVPEHNVWALFVHPEAEGKGIGKQLHDTLLQWYFSQTKETLWLSTATGTRAERFYGMNGWKEAGMHNHTERRFEMSYEDWKRIRSEGL